MIKIGIDARLYFQTGVGVYIRNLLHNLEKIAPQNVQFNVYVMESDAENITFENPQFILRPTAHRWHSFSEQIGFYDKHHETEIHNVSIGWW